MMSLVKHRNEVTGHDLAKREYWRDNRDRIVAWKRGTANIPNGMETGRGDRYAYDAEGQLTQASYRALNPEPWLTLSDPKRSDSFQYDALGNRYGAAQVASRGAMNFTRRDNGLNQYLMWAPMPVVYDDNWFPPSWVPPGNGVTMGDGYITASYNSLNQPVAMGSMGLGNNFYWFWHDPLGRCVKRWLGNVNQVPTGPITYFYYDGWNLVQEGPNASTADRLYVHGGRVDEIVASQVGGQWYNHHYDARGHCILLTTANGTLQEQYDYDAFGFPYFYTATGAKLNTSAVKTRFLFTGREWLSDLRVYDYRRRHYQPELGRFLQPDPLQFAAGDFNLYRYCHNDPINRNDPNGEMVQAVVVPAVIIVAGAVLVTPQGRAMFSNFAKAAVGAYKNWRDSLHNTGDSGVIDIPDKYPPPKGPPDSTVRGGEQTRRYGPDGYPETDRDRPHPGDRPPGDSDHAHDWTRPPGGGPPEGPPKQRNPYRGDHRDPKPGDPPPPRNGPKEIPHDASF